VDYNGFVKKKNRDWDKVEYLMSWRGDWAWVCNTQLEPDKRIDHRTLKAQGIDREPTIHVGRNPERARLNEEIKERNKAREEDKPENIAKRLHELKQKYMNLDKEIAALQHESTVEGHEIKSLRHKAEQMAQRVEQIRDMGWRLEEMRLQRRGMGFFERKKEIDAQIQSMEQSYSQARDTFMRQFQIEPSAEAIEAKRIEFKEKDAALTHSYLQERTAPYVEEKDKVMQEYQKQKLLAEFSPNWGQIQQYLKQLAESAHESTKGLLDRIRAERVLDTVTEKNLHAIMEKSTPEQVLILTARRERERVRLREWEQQRDRWHNRGR